MSDKRVFRDAKYRLYSIEKKQALAIVVNKCEEEHDSELERMKRKTHWDLERKCNVLDTLKWRYLTKAVCLLNLNLASVKISGFFQLCQVCLP